MIHGVLKSRLNGKNCVKQNKTRIIVPKRPMQLLNGAIKTEGCACFKIALFEAKGSDNARLPHVQKRAQGLHRSTD